eukprot:617276-Prymnesium_polylepis.2
MPPSRTSWDCGIACGRPRPSSIDNTSVCSGRAENAHTHTWRPDDFPAWSSPTCPPPDAFSEKASGGH